MLQLVYDRKVFSVDSHLQDQLGHTSCLLAQHVRATCNQLTIHVEERSVNCRQDCEVLGTGGRLSTTLRTL